MSYPLGIYMHTVFLAFSHSVGDQNEAAFSTLRVKIFVLLAFFFAAFQITWSAIFVALSVENASRRTVTETRRLPAPASCRGSHDVPRSAADLRVPCASKAPG